MNIFDMLTIKIKLRGSDEPVIAIVTLNFNEQIEIRFAPIMWKQNRTGIFFSMPSLKDFGYQKCAVVIKEDEYKTLTDLVMKQFLETAKDFYHPNEYELIEKAVSNNALRAEEEVNPDDIPL